MGLHDRIKGDEAGNDEQPTARCSTGQSEPDSSCTGQPASVSSASVGWYASLQWSHNLRANRCATTQSNADVTRNGSTPISTNRIGVDAALFVCNVDSTK